MNLPVLFKEFALPGREVINRNVEEKAVSIGDRIRFAKDMSIEIWKYANLSSVQYCRALKMTKAEIDTLEHLQGYLSVILFDRLEIMLIPKNTCGCPYGAGWEYLMQPRISNITLPSVGLGTSFVAVLPPEVNEEVITAIKNGKTEIKEGRIWP